MQRKNVCSGPKCLIGHYIYLKSLQKKDLKYVEKWGKDQEIMKLIGEVEPWTKKTTEKWFNEQRKSEDQVWFAIIIKHNGRMIGEAGLLRIFKPWRATDMSIIIGEKDCWGKGYGTEVAHLLFRYIFETMKFHRVSIGVVGFNKRAIRFWKKVGFKQEGIHRDGYYYNGQFSDFIMMSILEDDYKRIR